MNPLEILATITTIVCVLYSSKQNILAWPIGIVSAISLIVIYLEANLYANILLQSIFLVQCSVGWYNWSKKDSIKVSKLRLSKLIQDLIVFITLGCIYAIWDIWYNDRITWVSSYLDGIGTFLALLGNWYLTKKIIQAWSIFIVYNIIMVFLLASQGIYMLALLNFCLPFISFNGYITWKRNLIKV